MNEATLDAVRISLLVAAVGTAACIVVGTPLAWVVARAPRPLSVTVSAVTLLPLALPPTAVGYYLLWLLGRESPVGRFLLESVGLQLAFTWPGAAIAAAMVALPLFVRTAIAGFEQLDEDLLLTARTMVSPPRAFLLVVLPLAWRSLLAACVIAFARCLGEFGATVIVAASIPGRTQTLPAAIYDATQAGNDAQAHELALVALGIGFILILALTLLLRRAVKGPQP